MTISKIVEHPVLESEPSATPTCPLCHTEDTTITSQALAEGGTWRCTRCGQMWGRDRLATAAAYALAHFGANMRVM